MPRVRLTRPDGCARGPGGSGSTRVYGQLPMACALLAWAFPVVTAAHAEPCTIARSADIPVTMSGLRPMVHAQINGQDALLLADSGAFFSTLTQAAAEKFHLPYMQFPGLYIEGVGGREAARVVRVRKFTLVGAQWSDVEFFVAGGSFAGEAVGLLGQNVFRIADVEYDLANGVMRLVKPKGDCKQTALAYWADAAKKHWSVIDIESATATQPHTRSVAYLNGVKIHVIFDTGATQSVLTLGAARQAGITPTSTGVTDAGRSHGIGRNSVQTWIARFSSFKIGDEEILHAQLRFGDLNLVSADMLIGADFFLSHRVYVASSQNRLYFTYNGGPVFDLSAAGEPATADGAAASPGASTESPVPDAALRLDEPTDAPGFARRAAAFEARHDYDAAIADLNRACELAPTESSYFYQRGVVYLQKQQPDPALADLDRAIRLKPDGAEALLARASVRYARQAPAELVVADLKAADAALPNDDDLRLRLGNVYEAAGQPAAAVLQYSKWIDSHRPDDSRMPMALDSRCWARALAGEELEQALLDCDAALKMKPNTARYLESRGLVYLRQSNYDKAIADYDAALKLGSKSAWSLYGRGLAKSHKGLTAESRADIAAATAVEPKIEERARRFGIAP